MVVNIASVLPWASFSHAPVCHSYPQLGQWLWYWYWQHSWSPRCPIADVAGAVVSCRLQILLQLEKELKTLHLTLLDLQSHGGESIRSTTVFYFTDNSTTYWIAQAGSSPIPRLHSLIWQIKCLELDLGIQLQVVHVPGVVMIQQGSDALSRGVWVTPFQAITDQRTLTAAVFAPLTPDSHLIKSYINRYRLPSDLSHPALVGAMACELPT